MLKKLFHYETKHASIRIIRKYYINQFTYENIIHYQLYYNHKQRSYCLHFTIRYNRNHQLIAKLKAIIYC